MNFLIAIVIFIVIVLVCIREYRASKKPRKTQKVTGNVQKGKATLHCNNEIYYISREGIVKTFRGLYTVQKYVVSASGILHEYLTNNSVYKTDEGSYVPACNVNKITIELENYVVEYEEEIE